MRSATLNPSRLHRLNIYLASLTFMLPFSADVSALTDSEAQGKELALEFCQACHHYAGTEQAGTVAPPLLQMKSRFPDRQKLFSIIYDPVKELKPHTMMPPFGRNQLMNKDEINKVIDFLYTL